MHSRSLRSSPSSSAVWFCLMAIGVADGLVDRRRLRPLGPLAVQVEAIFGPQFGPALAATENGGSRSRTRRRTTSRHGRP